MRSRELSPSNIPISPPSNFEAMARRLCLYEGVLDDVKREAMPHIVDFNVDALARSSQQRRTVLRDKLRQWMQWAQRYAVRGFAVEPILDEVHGTVLRWSFGNTYAAILFRARFTEDVGRWGV